MSARTVSRGDWSAVKATFAAFFAGLGAVTIDDDAVAFTAASVGTGFELRRDGTSSSFMPLHGLEARWDEVAFDDDANEVRIRSAGTTYTYRVPPALLG